MHLLQGSSDGGHSLCRGECGIEIVGETELGPVLSFSLNLVYVLSVLCPQVCHRMVTFVLQPCLVLPYEDTSLCQPRPRLLQAALGKWNSLSHGLQEGVGCWQEAPIRASYGKHDSRFSHS